MTQTTLPADAWPSRASAWYAVGVLTLAYTFSFIDRSILSLLVGPIRADLEISDTAFSLLHGLAFALFYTFMGVPIGRLADTRNRRIIIAIGVALWSLMTALCGLARNFWQLFLARVGVGVGEAALSPAAYSMIADSFPPQNIGRALGLYSTGVFLGTGLAFLIGGLVIEAVSTADAIVLPLFGPMAAWQVTFFIVGLPGVLVALLVLTLKEPVRKHLSADAQARAAGQQGQPISVVIDFIRKRARALISHFVGFSMLALLFNAIMAWAPEYFIRTFGMSRGETGFYLGLIVMVFGSAGIACGGLAMDYLSRHGYRDAPLRASVLGGVVLVPLAAITTLMPSATLSLLLFCPLLFFVSFPFGPAAAGLQLVAPNEMRAQISALYLFTVNLVGIGFGPTAAALITDYVFADDAMLRYSIALLGGIAGTAGCVILWLGMAPFRKSVESLSATKAA